MYVVFLHQQSRYLCYRGSCFRRELDELFIHSPVLLLLLSLKFGLYHKAIIFFVSLLVFDFVYKCKDTANICIGKGKIKKISEFNILLQFMTARERIEYIIKELNINAKTLSEALGYDRPQIIYDILKSKTKSISENLSIKISSVYPQFNRAWILTGEGDIWQETASSTPSSATECIPLYEGVAVGGKGGFDFALQDIKAYYNVPKFHGKRVDFMIEVSGSSMMPKYNSGDVVACSVINEATFIQWNKVHVIATREQGILIKRVLPAEDEGMLRLVSDNKDYPPFDVPRSEICGLALVAGVIRLE